PPLRPLNQRVALRSMLAPLCAHETTAYIAERLRIAGSDVRTIFTPEAVATVHGCSGGIPRTISVVCDNALVSGFALDQRPIGRSIVLEVCRDFDLPLPRSEGAVDASIATLVPSARPAAAAMAVGTSLILA